MTFENSGQKQENRITSRWNLVWFIPLCIIVFVVTESHTVPFALYITKLAYSRWDWGIFISPAAALCLAALFYSIWYPIQGLILMYGCLSERKWKAILIVAAIILVLPFVTDTIIWGSFPFMIDDAGVYRIRTIPFIPWPYGKYLDF